MQPLPRAVASYSTPYRPSACILITIQFWLGRAMEKGLDALVPARLSSSRNIQPETLTPTRGGKALDVLTRDELSAIQHRALRFLVEELGFRSLALEGDDAKSIQLDEYVRDGDFSSASGYRETCALLALAEPPTAIVAASDLMALAALQAIRDAGLEPGRDVAVVGFDDLEAAALAHPPLTTIRQDRRELGMLAATRAMELVEGPAAPVRRTVLPVELVVRASSSA